MKPIQLHLIVESTDRLLCVLCGEFSLPWSPVRVRVRLFDETTPQHDSLILSY